MLARTTWVGSFRATRNKILSVQKSKYKIQQGAFKQNPSLEVLIWVPSDLLDKTPYEQAAAVKQGMANDTGVQRATSVDVMLDKQQTDTSHPAEHHTAP